MKKKYRLWSVLIIVVSISLLISGIFVGFNYFIKNVENEIKLDNNDIFMRPPKAYLQPKLEPKEPLNVTFNIFVITYKNYTGTIHIDPGDNSTTYIQKINHNITAFINRGYSLLTNITKHMYRFLRVYEISYYIILENGYLSETEYILLNLTQVGNINPVAIPLYEQMVLRFIDQPVLLSGAPSYDIDGNITGYYWYFGDGTCSKMENGIKGFIKSMITSHKYEKIGIYIAQLWVMDNQGNFTPDMESGKIEIHLRPTY